MSLHTHNIAQETEVMQEHFRTHTRYKIDGRAKAMVATGSGLHSVRYKQELDRRIKEKDQNDVHRVVAFLGTVEDPDNVGGPSTERSMNAESAF